MLNKNDVVTVEITDIGVGGEGIGRVDGYTLFIKDAIIGDVVEAKVMKAKKNYGYARMMEIIHPSADRVEPKCAFARKCAGGAHPPPTVSAPLERVPVLPAQKASDSPVPSYVFRSFPNVPQQSPPPGQLAADSGWLAPQKGRNLLGRIPLVVA